MLQIPSLICISTFWHSSIALFFAGMLIVSIANAEDGPLTLAVHAATAEQRLLMDQVDQLLESGQPEEAQQILSRLFDEAEGRVMEADAVQRAASLTARRFIPLRHWVQARYRQLLEASPSAFASYRSAHDDVAQEVLADVSKSNDLELIESAAERYALTSAGLKLRYLLCDHYLERGWTIAARQSLNLAASNLRLPIDPDSKQPPGSVSWTSAWPKIVSLGKAEDFVRQWRSKLTGSGAIHRDAGDLDRELAGAVSRLVRIAALENSAEDLDSMLSWSATIAKVLEESAATEINRNRDTAQQWFRERVKLNGIATASQLATFAGNAARTGDRRAKVEIGGWYSWTQQLDRHTSSNDRNAGSKPRVAESELGIIPYHPLIYEGRVFVNELRRIVAFDLRTGKPWPAVSPALPLFDSGISADALVPMGYPRIGVPRGTLSIVGDCLYARMGSPITGWINRDKNNDGGSLGFIVGLDLKRQGKLLPGFPLRFLGDDFRDAEPDGCPLAIGSLLFIPVAQRDNVGVSRFVVAVDRIGGQLKWRSRILATGTVEGSQQANLVAHQLLSHAGGRLFYNTNLGSIACLSPSTGQIEWLVRYRRASIDSQSSPKANRYLYRDLTPCVVEGDLVYCAPQDCEEIFALDSSTGDLVWSTNDRSASDAIHILGIEGNTLVVSGDRILWFDRLSGRILARFPAATTPGPLNSLPSPRGIGRGLLSGGEVFWPTAREIYVFPAAITGSPASTDAPPMSRRIRLDTRGAEGGNLLASENWLLLSAPSRLFAFRQPATKAAAMQPISVFGFNRR